MIEAKKIFVVGIGGIGVSALARILRGKGKSVSGSDVEGSEIVEDLRRVGIQVSIGHRAENLPEDCDLLIYSNAVPENNPERTRARSLKITALSYPRALGELLMDYEKVIAVAGTNGKTTTTAMIGWILVQTGFDPTVLVGSKVLAWNSNAHVGGQKYFVLEADEYKRAFLNYPADVAVITNITVDHLDYYRDFKDIQDAFLEFVDKIKPRGTLVADDLSLFSLPRPGEGLWEGSNRVKKVKYAIFDYDLKVPGKFNQANAAAAAAACEALGVPKDKIARALASFIGTWRRFEKVGRLGKSLVISDYAHHPDGIKVTLQTGREEYPDKKILTVFQPHQHNRTKMLFKEFVRAFCQSPLQDFIIAEIFDVAGREETGDQDVSSKDLVREIEKCGKKVLYASDLRDCEQKVRAAAKNYDVIILMGAGDIYKVANKLVS